MRSFSVRSDGGRHDEGRGGEIGLRPGASVPGDQRPVGEIAHGGGDGDGVHGDHGTGGVQVGDHPERGRRAAADRRPGGRRRPDRATLTPSSRMARSGLDHGVGGLLVADGDPDPVGAETGEGLAAADREAALAQRVRAASRARGRRAASRGDRPARRAPRARRHDRQTEIGQPGRAGDRGAGRSPRPRRRRSARAVSDRQAIIAASAGVDTDHGGCCARQRGDHVRVADGVAGAEPGESPGLGQRPQHQQPGHRAAAISVSGSPGTASMNASSTTTQPPGPDQARRIVGRVQHAGRVGRVADHDQVGVGGHPRRGRARSRRSAVSITRRGRCPAARSAASGSVNCGCTTTGARHGRARASRVNASAPPGRRQHLLDRDGRARRRSPPRPRRGSRIAGQVVDAGA